MSSPIVTLDEAQIVAVPISHEMTQALGLKPGSRFEVKVEDHRIVLEPLLADDLDQPYGICASNPGSTEDTLRDRREDEEHTQRPKRPRLSPQESKDLILAMQETFKDAGYSLEDDLIQMRKEEAEYSLRKYGC
jgi:bifunctional DNA-binding transcriptional regulator/antitoxin component of YhaV-PrlF toxin-antitoxin module